MSTRWVVGADFGQSQDYTAICAVEQSTVKADGRSLNHYAVRHLERFPLSTPYTTVVARLKELFAEPPLKGVPLAADATGCGRPILDMIRAAGVTCWLRGITITGGSAATEDKTDLYRSITVPKRNLVSTVQILLQSRRLAIAAELREAKTLTKELANFKAKITLSGNETFGAGEDWRTGHNDDLVLAVSLACWLGERLFPPGSGIPVTAAKGTGTLVPMPGRW